MLACNISLYIFSAIVISVKSPYRQLFPFSFYLCHSCICIASITSYLFSSNFFFGFVVVLFSIEPVEPWDSTDPWLKNYLQCSVAVILLNYFQVYDGSSASAPVLAEPSGVQTGLVVKSSTNQVFMKFRTNAETTSTGFSLSWTAVSLCTKSSKINHFAYL